MKTDLDLYNCLLYTSFTNVCSWVVLTVLSNKSLFYFNNSTMELELLILSCFILCSSCCLIFCVALCWQSFVVLFHCKVHFLFVCPPIYGIWILLRYLQTLFYIVSESNANVWCNENNRLYFGILPCM